MQCKNNLKSHHSLFLSLRRLKASETMFCCNLSTFLIMWLVVSPTNGKLKEVIEV